MLQALSGIDTSIPRGPMMVGMQEATSKLASNDQDQDEYIVSKTGALESQRNEMALGLVSIK